MPRPDHTAQWQRSALTRDGAEYRIRPIRPDDSDHDRDFIMQLSEASRFTRMMGSMREPSKALIDHLVGVDYHRDMAFVAVIGSPDSERIIGVARYAADASKRDGEFAVAVSDAWQSRGIGTALMRVLLKYAKDQGLRRIHGLIFAHNDRMIDLARKLGMNLRRPPDDYTVVEAAQHL